nr:hypothetical protein [Psychrobacter sp. PraFG1]UNK05593.1 hypothetical protein MN210_01485 [Psychrobacter sp. PraFG1]
MAKVSGTFWVEDGLLMKSLEPAWDIAGQTYAENCSVCHRQPNPASHDANQWPGLWSGMVGFTNLDADTGGLVLKYLQLNSSDFAGAKMPQAHLRIRLRWLVHKAPCA